MTDYVNVSCGVCKTTFGMPREMYNVMHAGAGTLTWYCPYGHQRTFTQGESDLDKMRRERDQAIQRTAEYQDAYHEAEARRALAERKVSAAKGQITKIKKRAANGVCPCCNRTFSDLGRHMHSKHPGFVTEPTADEHVH